jgi:hypothetical protein
MLLYRLYCAYADCAVVTGEVQQSMFSAAAQHASQQTRIQLVQGFATRLQSIRESIESV